MSKIRTRDKQSPVEIQRLDASRHNNSSAQEIVVIINLKAMKKHHIAFLRFSAKISLFIHWVIFIYNSLVVKKSKKKCISM